MNTSLRPLANVSSSTRVTVSVGLIVALVVGAFRLGAEQSNADRLQDERMARIESAIATQTAILDRMERRQSEAEKVLADLNSRASRLAGAIDVVDTRLRERNRNQ